MIEDARLERLSDLVRRGAALGFNETIEVIDYQRARRAAEQRRPSWWQRLRCWWGDLQAGT